MRFQYQQVKLPLSCFPNMLCIEYIAASHPASCPPRSCKFSHAFVTSSFTILMTTFPAILRSTSPTPIGRKPGSLSRGASLPAINFWSDAVFWNSILLMQICLVDSAIALRRSDVQLPNIFDVNIFLHPPASNLCFWPLLLSLISHYFIYVVKNNTMNYRFTINKCFLVSKSWVSFHLAQGYHLPYYLLTTSMPHWCFLFPSILQTFSKASAIFFGSLFDVNLCWMVSVSNNKDLISPHSHNCSRLSRTSKCSLRFDVLLGFSNNKVGIVCIAFRLIDLWCILCSSAQESSDFFDVFSAFPVGNIKRFFLQNTIFW